MFPIPLEIGLPVIYIGGFVLVISMAIYFSHELSAKFRIWAKSMPETAVAFCIFCRAIVLRVSNLVIGIIFGLYCTVYPQFNNGAMPPMNIFVGFASVLFVCACFGAWREQFLEVQSQKAKLPEFQYRSDGSKIDMVVHMEAIPWTVRVDFRLRFENRGNGVAFDPSDIGYGCFIYDEPVSVFDFGRTASVWRVNPGESLHRNLWASNIFREIKEGEPVFGKTHTLIMLFEIEAHLYSRNGAVYKNEELWLSWHPSIPDRAAMVRPEELELAREHIERFKATSQSTPPS